MQFSHRCVYRWDKDFCFWTDIYKVDQERNSFWLLNIKQLQDAHMEVIEKAELQFITCKSFPSQAAKVLHKTNP